mmetsp:Transcript_32429/g.72705  ORF Transcript_32429/g.72705 Transcript_32429/m.72705 type:complete len:395 (-) Transcript_32429:201-1385(-)
MVVRLSSSSPSVTKESISFRTEVAGESAGVCLACLRWPSRHSGCGPGPTGVAVLTGGGSAGVTTVSRASAREPWLLPSSSRFSTGAGAADALGREASNRLKVLGFCVFRLAGPPTARAVRSGRWGRSSLAKLTRATSSLSLASSSSSSSDRQAMKALGAVVTKVSSWDCLESDASWACRSQSASASPSSVSIWARRDLRHFLRDPGRRPRTSSINRSKSWIQSTTLARPTPSQPMGCQSTFAIRATLALKRLALSQASACWSCSVGVVWPSSSSVCTAWSSSMRYSEGSNREPLPGSASDCPAVVTVLGSGSMATPSPTPASFDSARSPSPAAQAGVPSRGGWSSLPVRCLGVPVSAGWGSGLRCGAGRGGSRAAWIPRLVSRGGSSVWHSHSS